MKLMGLAKVNIQPKSVSLVLTTDDAGFIRKSVFNLHNNHIWADKNPHVIRQHHFQEQFGLNVWLRIIDEFYIMPRRLNEQHYLEFLSNVLSDTHELYEIM